MDASLNRKVSATVKALSPAETLEYVAQEWAGSQKTFTSPTPLKPKESGSAKRPKNQHTKRIRIWIAFLTELENKPLEDISIQDICETAMIHRTTFYNHFHNVFDLIRYGFNLIASGLIPDDIAKFNIDEMSDKTVDFIKRYRKVLSNVTKTEFRDELFRSCDKVFEEYLYRAITATKDGYTLNLPPGIRRKVFLRRIFASAFCVDK